MTIHEEITIKEKDNMHLAELETLNEDKLIAQQKLDLYRHQIPKAFNEEVRH